MGALWTLAGVCVVAMALAHLARPLAAPVVAADPATYLDAAAIARAEAFRAPLRAAGLLAVGLRAGAALLAAWWLWRRRPDAAPGSRWRRCLQAGVLGVAVWAVSDVVRLPLGVWSWARSVEVGLSTQDLPAWAWDWTVQAVPYWLGVGLAVAGVAWAIERLPQLWIPAVGLVGGVVGVGLMVLSPLVFEPVLLDFTPLEEGSLRDAVSGLAAQVGVEAELLVADASRRTTASNAYVSGLGATRRIVLYDTLVADAPQPEVLAIVAHELAHDRNRDLERTAVGLAGGVVLLVAAVGWLLRHHLRVGEEGPGSRIRPGIAAPATALVIVLLVLLGPVERWASRRAESAADAGAIALTEDGPAYAQMMAGLAVRNVTDPAPPGWYVILFGSHPPPGERIARARAGD